MKLIEKTGRQPIAYLTIAFTPKADPLKEVLFRTLTKVGKISLSPPPPTPAMLELKKMLQTTGVISSDGAI